MTDDEKLENKNLETMRYLLILKYKTSNRENPGSGTGENKIDN